MVHSNYSANKERFKAERVRTVVARGRFRFLVLHTLVGTIILWVAANASFLIRGRFYGTSLAYLLLLEMAVLFAAFPFALAIGWLQWKKFQKMAASVDGLSVGDQNATRDARRE